MIKVLHVLSALDNGGVENTIKTVYGCLDHEKILFDFLVFGH